MQSFPRLSSLIEDTLAMQKKAGLKMAHVPRNYFLRYRAR
jgi:hypothetical protein